MSLGTTKTESTLNWAFNASWWSSGGSGRTLRSGLGLGVERASFVVSLCLLCILLARFFIALANYLPSSLTILMTFTTVWTETSLNG